MSQEYLTELFYPSRFYDFMSPVLLNYLAALHGFPPRPLQPGFRYCELGCGGGMTLNTLAASNPQGRFVGVDINAEHIAYAREQARQADLSNIEYVEADIRDLDWAAWEDFDFITLHGVWSWVSEQTRAGLLDFIKDQLKPGGLLMVSYNAMPGSAVIQPIRDMMLLYTEAMEGSALDKVQAGMDYLRYLSAREAAYFADNPLAKDAVDNLFNKDTHYLAHEFFNQYWQPFYFLEVAERMSDAGLSFVGTLPVLSNYLEAAVPEVFQEFFHTATDRITLERHKAFVRNERFRRDVYVKTEDWALDGQAREELFKPLCFGTEYYYFEETAVVYSALNEQLQIDMSLEPRHSLATALLAQGRSFADLLSLDAVSEHSAADCLEALNLLVLGGDFRPFAQPAQHLLDASRGDRLAIPCAFNRQLLADCHRFPENVIYLASPVIGDGVGLPLLDALLLYGLTLQPPQQVPQWAVARLQEAEKNLNVEGEGIDDPQMQLELLEQHLDKLLAHKLGKFLELGLVSTR